MLRFLTAGESHGPSLTGVLEGMPAGLPLDSAVIDRELRRRQRGFGSGARMKIERDHAQITGGVMNGETTGGPIAFTINNRDHSKWANRDIAPMTVPRPGHADLTGAVKYGYRELRLSLERASARETAMRVAVGAACRALLGEFGVTIGGYVVNIGGVQVDAPGSADPECYRQRFAVAEACDVRCPDPAIATGMRAAIRRTIAARDTLGGTVEVAVLDALGNEACTSLMSDAECEPAHREPPLVFGLTLTHRDDFNYTLSPFATRTRMPGAKAGLRSSRSSRT